MYFYSLSVLCLTTMSVEVPCYYLVCRRHEKVERAAGGGVQLCVRNRALMDPSRPRQCVGKEGKVRVGRGCRHVVMLHALFCTGGQKYIMFLSNTVECVVGLAKLCWMYRWCFKCCHFFSNGVPCASRPHNYGRLICVVTFERRRKKKEASAVLTKVPVVLLNCLLA